MDDTAKTSSLIQFPCLQNFARNWMTSGKQSTTLVSRLVSIR